MKKTFTFGKIAYYSRRKINSVEVIVSLKKDNLDRWCFSAVGDIWNSTHTDIVCGGQILDDIARFIKDPTFVKIHRLWKKYHLNDARPGTREQERFLEENFKPIPSTTASIFMQKCSFLKENGLYEVPHPDRPGETYRYGEGWLYNPIPENDLTEMLALF